MAEQKKAGRPRGAPSQALPVRVPVGLIERLDRYLDLAETRTGLRSNRTEAIRQALAFWLDAKEEALGIPRTPSLPATPDARHQWRAAYDAVGQGRGFVRIHHIRDALGWSPQVFDRVVAMLAVEHCVELHGGDPGSLMAEELDRSYRDAHGTLYLTVSWRGLRDGDLTEAALPATGAPARIRSKAGARPTRA